MATVQLSITDKDGTTRVLTGNTDPANNSALIMGQEIVDPTTGARSAVTEAGALKVNSQSDRAHYRYAVPNFTPVAAPTEMFVIQGSATKTVGIRRIKVTGAATAAGSMQLTLTRRSSAGTLNTAVLTAVTACKVQSGNAAASAVVSSVGTANYQTPGTVVAQAYAGRLSLVAIGSAATSSDCQPNTIDFGMPNDQMFTLSGVSEWLTIDGEGSALPSGAKLDVSIDTVEY
jgi:hypothetical protein